MPLSVCSRTHIQLGSIPGTRRRSGRKRTASILVIFIGPTPSAAACARPVQVPIPAAALRLPLQLRHGLDDSVAVLEKLRLDVRADARQLRGGDVTIFGRW